MSSPRLAVVTGGAGFIGSHLCERLVKEGYRVISLDNYFTGSKDNHVPGVEYREGHTKDIARLIPENPDIVYHLGEYARVEQSLSEPDLVWDLNVAGTFGVLEFWRAHQCKLVYAGSSTKFGDGGLARIATPYAWTKAMNTELVQNYGAWYKLSFAITYFYNVYGPRERAGAYGTVVEIFKQKFHAGDPLTVVAPGTQKRNFTHVDDIVNGLVVVGERGFGDDYGLGNPREYTIIEIAKLFGGNIIMHPERPGNRMSSAIDISKTQLLGWKPERSLEEYIRLAKIHA
ncbi:NAD-dependent epimerase/dehydratase family protein [Patescibacteria group bacterium]|nr:NAD-dependent epimerase/dehydratase family protein [Patescibacteria group bacterium]